MWTTVGDISLSILYGVSESAKSAGKYRFLRITDIQNNRVNWDTVPYSDFEDNAQNYILEDGDILFARTGATVGKSYLVNDIPVSSIYASYLIRVKSTKSVLPEYVKLFFESGLYWEQISMTAVGVGQPNVNGTSLANLRIPLPPYNEQTRIVKESSNWLKRIDTLDNDMSELEDSVGRIKSKILDLAIQGKLVSQDPNDEPAIELLRRINPDFQPCDNAHYKSFPNNWVACAVNDVFDVNPKVSAEDSMEVAFIPMANIEDSFSNDYSYILKKWVDIKKGYTHFQDNDIAVAKISPCLENRKSAVFTNLPNGIGGGTTELNIFRSEVVTPLYGLCFFKSDYFISNCINSFNGVVGQQRVATKIIKDMTFFLPPYAEQQRIVAKIEELFATLDKIKESLEV